MSRENSSNLDSCCCLCQKRGKSLKRLESPFVTDLLKGEREKILSKKRKARKLRELRFLCSLSDLKTRDDDDDAVFVHSNCLSKLKTKTNDKSISISTSSFPFDETKCFICQSTFTGGRKRRRNGYCFGGVKVEDDEEEMRIVEFRELKNFRDYILTERRGRETKLECEMFLRAEVVLEFKYDVKVHVYCSKKCDFEILSRYQKMGLTNGEQQQDDEDLRSLQSEILKFKDTESINSMERYYSTVDLGEEAETDLVSVHKCSSFSNLGENPLQRFYSAEDLDNISEIPPTSQRDNTEEEDNLSSVQEKNSTIEEEQPSSVKAQSEEAQESSDKKDDDSEKTIMSLSDKSDYTLLEGTFLSSLFDDTLDKAKEITNNAPSTEKESEESEFIEANNNLEETTVSNTTMLSAIEPDEDVRGSKKRRLNKETSTDFKCEKCMVCSMDNNEQSIVLFSNGDLLKMYMDISKKETKTEAEREFLNYFPTVKGHIKLYFHSSCYYRCDQSQLNKIFIKKLDLKKETSPAKKAKIAANPTTTDCIICYESAEKSKITFGKEDFERQRRDITQRRLKSNNEQTFLEKYEAFDEKFPEGSSTDLSLDLYLHAKCRVNYKELFACYLLLEMIDVLEEKLK